MSEQITDISQILTGLSVAMAEAGLLLQQQREVLESNISDLNQRRDVEKIGKLKKETDRLRLAVRKSREAEKRRSDLEKKRKKLRKSFSK